MSVPPSELASTADLELFRARDDAYLLIQAEAIVRNYCRWHIAPARTEDLTVNGSGGITQPLPTMFLSAVSAVFEDGEPVDEFAWSQAGYLTRGRPWTREPRGVVASVTHGYADVPADVQAQVLDITNRASSVIRAGALVRLRVGDVDRTFGTGEDKQIVTVGLTMANKATLDAYRVAG